MIAPSVSAPRSAVGVIMSIGVVLAFIAAVFAIIGAIR
jgi:hypothetical protein